MFATPRTLIENPRVMFGKLKQLFNSGAPAARRTAERSPILKYVKAWLKPNLHKIRKTVITLPGFGIIFAELAA